MVVQIFGSLNRNKDGSVGFTLLVISEDTSLVLVEQPNAASHGMAIVTILALATY